MRIEAKNAVEGHDQGAKNMVLEARKYTNDLRQANQLQGDKE